MRATDAQTDETESEAADASELPEIPVETALEWLQRLKPADVLAVLRDPEMAFVTARAFIGFRFNSQGYHNPIVRGRLAQEIVREAGFRGRVQALVDAAPGAQAIPPRPEQARSTEPRKSTTDWKEHLDAEREQRRKERADSRIAAEEAKAANAALRREIEALGEAVAEMDAMRDSLNRSNHRVSRLERQVVKLKSERDALLRSIRATPTVAAPEKTVASPPPAAPAAVRHTAFEAAAYRLLSADNLDAAIAVAEAALTEEPSDLAALDVAATAYRKSGHHDKAAPIARDLALAALQAGELSRATQAVLMLLAVDSRTSLIESVSRPYVSALRSATREELETISKALSTAKAAQPTVYRRVAKLIEEYAPADTARALLTRANVIGPSDPLPLQMPEPCSAMSIVSAVDAGLIERVEAVRDALENLRASDSNEYGRVIEAIVSASGGDESCLRPLLRRTRGPAVLDASNAAWYDEAGVADRPRLWQILNLRTAIRLRGYFPVCLIGDAPLPHTIDDRERFAKMMARHEIMLVSTGTDADEAILREARRLDAPVVTNDYMADWDPGDEVEKIRYVIPPTGPAYLLS